ncbi:MAG: hypothetical protein WCT07_03805 [Candidatus Paceibacterota bacterium]|jgi:hypothetical protein
MSGTDLNNQEKLEEVYELTVENNEILRSIRRQQHIANAFRFLYWLVILGALGGAYYYVRPVVDSIFGNKVGIDSTLKQYEELRSQLPETKLLDQFLQGIKNSTNKATTTVQ